MFGTQIVSERELVVFRVLLLFHIVFVQKCSRFGEFEHRLVWVICWLEFLLDFLMHLGCHVGSILAPFWEPKSVMFGIVFL